VSKTRTTSLHPQSAGTVERHVKTVEGHLRKVVALHQRAWDARLPMFLLAYRTSTHYTTGLTPANRELRLPSDLLFGSPDIDNAADHVDLLNSVINPHLVSGCQHLTKQWPHKRHCVLYCCVFIRCRGHVFTALLLSVVTPIRSNIPAFDHNALSSETRRVSPAYYAVCYAYMTYSPSTFLPSLLPVFAHLTI
jgi:hypothetical protein